MLSFNNTEIAFSDKSDKELKKAFWLFKFISYPFLLSIGKPLLHFALWFHLPVKGIIKATFFNHFCGGENLEEVKKTITNLAKNNIKSIPDYSVEGQDSEVDFDRVTKEIISIIQFAKTIPNAPFAVFKVTGIASNELLEKASANKQLSKEEENEYQKIVKRVDDICKAAEAANMRVMIDAEETWIQGAIDSMTEQMMQKYNREKMVVYNTVQMYRIDRLQYIKNCVEKAANEKWFTAFKIVRGAYMEKERDRAEKSGYPSPIHKTKVDTDTDYNLALDFCLEKFPSVAIFAGTHNEESNMYLTEKMSERKINKWDEHIYFSQLFAMGDHISYNLASEGYNVAKYIPYGPVKDVVPYLIRRAEENTSVAGQTGRELNLINAEIKRRHLGR